jgi:hypothetical protein
LVRIAVIVRRPGHEDVPVAGFPSTIPEQMFYALWPRACEFWTRTCNEDERWDFVGSAARRNAVGILAAVFVPEEMTATA